jgi:aldehyde:ferredoxin oxidoreductase
MFTDKQAVNFSAVMHVLYHGVLSAFTAIYSQVVVPITVTVQFSSFFPSKIKQHYKKHKKLMAVWDTCIICKFHDWY